MKIRFPRAITLHCVEILVGEFEGAECELDMNITVTFEAGREFDNVEFDEDTPTDVRLWLRDDLVALDVPWSGFEIIEP
ncbi:MAG: hypothetical protein AB7I37_17785 [Pirellulales bacterium]